MISWVIERNYDNYDRDIPQYDMSPPSGEGVVHKLRHTLQDPSRHPSPPPHVLLCHHLWTCVRVFDESLFSMTKSYLYFAFSDSFVISGWCNLWTVLYERTKNRNGWSQLCQIVSCFNDYSEPQSQTKNTFAHSLKLTDNKFFKNHSVIWPQCS